MKPKIILLMLLTSVSFARADLVQLGVFDLTQPFPPYANQFFRDYSLGMQNLAGVNIVNGQAVWSPFTLFGDNYFNFTLNATGTGADISWDLTGTGFHNLFVFVESNDGGLFGNLYRVPISDWFEGSGFVDIDGHQILAVTFPGADHTLPETGHTIALMACGLLALLSYAASRKMQ